MTTAMPCHIELFEAIVVGEERGLHWALHMPVFRLNDGLLRRVSTGEVVCGRIHSMQLVSPWREADLMPLARRVAGV